MNATTGGNIIVLKLTKIKRSRYVIAALCETIYGHKPRKKP